MTYKSIKNPVTHILFQIPDIIETVEILFGDYSAEFFHQRGIPAFALISAGKIAEIVFDQF